MRLTTVERQELETLIARAEDGALRTEEEARLRRLLDSRNPGAAALPLDKLVFSGQIELGAAILLERLAPEAS